MYEVAEIAAGEEHGSLAVGVFSCKNGLELRQFHIRHTRTCAHGVELIQENLKEIVPHSS